VNVFCTDVAP
jgi:hypothetical protein